MIRKTQWGEDPQFSGPRDWFRNSLIIHEVKKRKQKGKVLDFGCGSGNLLIRLAKKGFSGVGVDASSLAVSFLKNKLQLYPSLSLSVHQGKENFLTKISEKFDVIVSGETLEHLKTDSKAVKAFYTLLKKQGICVVTVPAHMSLWDINDDYSSHYRRYERQELEELFRKQGFTVISCYYWGFPLSLWWHKYIFVPIIAKKAKQKSRTTNRIMTSETLQSLLSVIFWFDSLFDWTRLGGGLLLVAKK